MQVRVELVDNATVHFQALPEDIRKRLRVVMVRDGQQLLGIARDNLSGKVLNARSGDLRNSLKALMHENPATIYVEVTADTPYAAIHEYGGHTRPHVIEAVNAHALHFMLPAAGGWVFAKRVNHPGSKIPERSYLRSALAQMKDQIVSDIQDAARPNS